MTAAIYYVPEAYSIDGPKLMGRNAAGESFLRGFLAHTRPCDSFWLQVENKADVSHFSNKVVNQGRKEEINVFSNATLGRAKIPGVVYHPGPGIAAHARLRSAFGNNAWSLCGVTHTTSSGLAMDSIVDLLIAPLQPWDSLICTSTAVKKNVENILQAQAELLKDRLGASRFILPQLPVIPLGIHTQDFNYSQEQRNRARNELGANEDTLVVLYTGRLSFHAKAHPLQMYQGLELAAQRTGREVVLVECGWFANDYIEKAFIDAANLVCPSVRVVRLDGRLPKCKTTAWSGADIFCSLSDNIQETFGIVPIEAMAAGLPVVVSDWDGYKDTVREAVDGFRIPTLGPKPGLGGDLAHRHALGVDTYDMYCGYSSSLIGIHLEKLTEAFVRLFESPDLRYSMGRAGRIRAKEVYDWYAIIRRYEDLWDTLRENRLAASSSGINQNRTYPARLDPTISFSHYPTTLLDAQAELVLVYSSASEALDRIFKLKSLTMVSFAELVFPSDQEIECLIFSAVKHGPRVRAEVLISEISEPRRPFALRGLTWLVKLGIFTF
ncbi:glycosyltransferase family 4 protein [Gammaproteobacteria bacterium]|nr:glycosyltransferase family 4 protein [Gammaproteobacteria bacterium]